MNKNRWWNVLHKPQITDLRLFCFPYAGGAPHSFHGWRKKLPAGVEIIGTCYPGRGARIAEKPCQRIDELIPQLTEQILPLLDKPFVFYGHSMGSLIAYELASCLQRLHGKYPLQLMVSGHRCPRLPRKKPISHLSREQFIEEIKLLNGTPKELWEHQELLEVILPALRSDFAMLENFNYSPRPLLNCPILVTSGEEDHDVPIEELDLWGEFTAAATRVKVFPGDHFYIHSHEDDYLAFIGKELNQILQRSAIV